MRIKKIPRIKKKTEITSRLYKKVILNEIKTNFDNWIIFELPFDKKNSIRTYIFTRQEENYENIE
jgi:hypothetical protein